MRLLLNTILMLTTLVACYVEQIYFIAVPPKLGAVAPFTVRSQGFFTFDQDKALSGRRDIALSRYVPLYTYLPSIAEKVKMRIENLIKELSSLQEQKHPLGQELKDYLREEFGVEIDRDKADKLLRYRDLNSLLKGILTIEETIFQNIIIEDPKPYSGKRKIEVLYSEPKGIVAHSTEEIITVEQARFILKDKVNQLFWQVDEDVLDPVIDILQTTLVPTLKYDQKENTRRIEEIVRHYPSKIIHYKPGDVLVPFNKILNEENLLLITSHHESVKKDLYGNTPWIFIVVLLIVAFHNMFLSKFMSTGRRKPVSYQALFSLMIISIFLFKACLLFTPFPIYFIPFALLPLLISTLNFGGVLATWSTVIGAILLTLFSARTLETFLFFTLGGFVAVLLSFKIQKRIHILLPSLIIGIMNVIVLLAFSTNCQNINPLLANWQEIWIYFQTIVLDRHLLGFLGWAFMGGVLAGPMALLLLPILEVSWHATSNFKLTKYSDLQHPLLKDLFAKIPSTYQHSMTIAFLAQAAGEAVGANTLLLRIGAYYHDIGKMANPMFFSENQSSGENPHDNLDPHESAQIIINHVKYGEQIGRKMGLPLLILDFIRQHHGTMFVEYFYNKAFEANNESKPLKKDFRYPGPKPQSREAAILMIVDSVEATFRSMEAATREKIEKMIILNIVKRIADGQFNECNLSTLDLAKIIETLTDSLEATFHSRITYPWQKKNKR